MTSTEKYIGENIKRLREKNGLTRSQFADAIDASVSIVSRVENGTKMPSIALLDNIAAFFGITLSQLVKESHT